jgi:hypothetical protein
MSLVYVILLLVLLLNSRCTGLSLRGFDGESLRTASVESSIAAHDPNDLQVGASDLSMGSGIVSINQELSHLSKQLSAQAKHYSDTIKNLERFVYAVSFFCIVQAIFFAYLWCKVDRLIEVTPGYYQYRRLP